MNSKVTKIGSGVLFLVALGIWAPQMFVGLPFLSENEEGEREEMPAELDGGGAFPGGEGALPGGDEPGLSASGSSPEVLVDRSTGGDETSISTGVDMKNFGNAGGSDALSRLAASWNQREDDEDENDSARAAALLESNRPDLERIAIEDFLSEGSLDGIIKGETIAIATFGDHVLREGDALFGGRLVVVGIEERSLTFALDGRRLRIDMPPFQFRAGGSSGDSDFPVVPGDESTPAPEAGAEELPELPQ